jgi:hypothetical protein
VKIFISYASEDGDVAEPVHLALVQAGHETFVDDADFPRE